MVTTQIQAGICGFSTIVKTEKKTGHTVVFTLQSECVNWQKFNDILGGKELNMIEELFKNRATGKVDSQVLNTALEMVPHISCPVISGLLKSLEVCAGLALPKDASIVFEK